MTHWEPKFYKHVPKISVYLPNLLKILFSSRTGLKFEKKTEVRGSSSRESSNNLPEGRDGNQDDDNKNVLCV